MFQSLQSKHSQAMQVLERRTSIHSASMSPSSRIHWCLFVLLLDMSRKVVLMRPSLHSRVDGCTYPYSSFLVTACMSGSIAAVCARKASETSYLITQSIRLGSLQKTSFKHYRENDWTWASSHDEQKGSS